MSNKETKELFDLMDQVPNAKRVAEEYRRLMREGKLDPQKDVTDAGAGWLMVEDELLRDDHAKSYNYRVSAVCVTIILLGLGLSVWWQYRHENNLIRQLAANDRCETMIASNKMVTPMPGVERKNGIYTFHEASLRDIGGMIDKRFEIKVVFDDPAMSKQCFTGSMDPCQSLDAFMNVVKYSTPVDYYFRGGTLHIQQRLSHRR